MKWQPIAAKRPKHNQRVLVCYDTGFCGDDWHTDNSNCQVATYKYPHDFIKPRFELDCESVGGYLNLTIDEGYVTHWMPLPEPPEEMT